MKFDFGIIFSAFFLMLFTATLQGDSTSSNSKHWLGSVSKSGQGTEESRNGGEQELRRTGIEEGRN